MRIKTRRREFLGQVAGIAVMGRAGAKTLAGTPSGKEVQLRCEIEPLVRLLEETPRERLSPDENPTWAVPYRRPRKTRKIP